MRTLDLTEAAAFLGLHPHTLQARAKAGQIPGAKIGREWSSEVDWHTFRHTFASWHVMSGTPLEVLQKLGGWSDMRMLMKYAHLAPEFVARYANNAKPWSQKAAMGVA